MDISPELSDSINTTGHGDSQENLNFRMAQHVPFTLSAVSRPDR